MKWEEEENSKMRGKGNLSLHPTVQLMVFSRKGQDQKCRNLTGMYNGCEERRNNGKQKCLEVRFVILINFWYWDAILLLPLNKHEAE